MMKNNLNCVLCHHLFLAAAMHRNEHQATSNVRFIPFILMLIETEKLKSHRNSWSSFLLILFSMLKWKLNREIFVFSSFSLIFNLFSFFCCSTLPTNSNLWNCKIIQLNNLSSFKFVSSSHVRFVILQLFNSLLSCSIALNCILMRNWIFFSTADEESFSVFP